MPRIGISSESVAGRVRRTNGNMHQVGVPLLGPWSRIGIPCGRQGTLESCRVDGCHRAAVPASKKKTLKSPPVSWAIGPRSDVSGIATPAIAKNVRLVSRNRVVSAMTALDPTLACGPAKKRLPPLPYCGSITLGRLDASSCRDWLIGNVPHLKHTRTYQCLESQSMRSF